MSFKFKAKDAKIMMLHKDDIMFGLFFFFFGEIQAAAYAGNSGTRIEVPIGLTHYAEFEIGINEMIKKGFTITDGYATSDGMYRFGVYWAID